MFLIVCWSHLMVWQHAWRPGLFLKLHFRSAKHLHAQQLGLQFSGLDPPTCQQEACSIDFGGAMDFFASHRVSWCSGNSSTCLYTLFYTGHVSLHVEDDPQQQLITIATQAVKAASQQTRPSPGHGLKHCFMHASDCDQVFMMYRASLSQMAFSFC